MSFGLSFPVKRQHLLEIHNIYSIFSHQKQLSVLWLVILIISTFCRPRGLVIGIENRLQNELHNENCKRVKCITCQNIPKSGKWLQNWGTRKIFLNKLSLWLLKFLDAHLIEILSWENGDHWIKITDFRAIFSNKAINITPCILY